MIKVWFIKIKIATKNIGFRDFLLYVVEWGNI